MRNKVCVSDGSRVARLDANNEGTIFIGNYFEARYPAEEELISPFFDCASEGSNCTYLPIVGNTEVNELFTGKPGVSYYYSGNQRIAMRTGGEAYLLFGDHLGSSSLLVKADGTIAEKAYYLPWGGTRGEETITSTDYGYTGQMREGDIYYFGARYYDPAIGRFMQADTIVPLNVQGTQAFDRYAYVNNNPLRYTDPSGNFSEDEIMGYLNSYCSSNGCNSQSVLNEWQNKSAWWALITDAVAGDTIYIDHIPKLGSNGPTGANEIIYNQTNFIVDSNGVIGLDGFNLYAVSTGNLKTGYSTIASLGDWSWSKASGIDLSLGAKFGTFEIGGGVTAEASLNQYYGNAKEISVNGSFSLGNGGSVKAYTNFVKPDAFKTVDTSIEATWGYITIGVLFTSRWKFAGMSFGINYPSGLGLTISRSLYPLLQEYDR